jgi:cytosine deaminase
VPANFSTVVDDRDLGRLVLRGGALEDGRFADIAIDARDGRIAAVGVVESRPGDTDEDCSGLVIVPSGVEVHAHLDKALSSPGGAMPADLGGAVEDWLAMAPQFDHDSFVERATRAIEAMVARGTTAVRTHVDIGTAMGLRGVHALIAVREEMRRRGLADVQIVGLALPPFGGSAGHASRHLLESAVEAGIDIVGGSPDIDPDPLAATQVAVAVAAASGLPIDLHTDQTIDASFFFLPDYIRLVEEQRVTCSAASHCVSLASQPRPVQEQVSADLARIGMSVFTMPLTSLFYFGWDVPVGPPRGVTAIHALLDAGVRLAAGSDNVRDVFFPLGGFDQFETAAVLAMVAHVSPEQAWTMCSDVPRAALGLPAVAVAVGSPADLVAIAGRNLSEAVAGGSQHRTVLRHGRIVARTTTNQQLLG